MLELFDADERSSWINSSIPALELEVYDLNLFLIWSSQITELGELEALCAWARSEDGRERHRILKEELRSPQDPIMTALIIGALMALERLKYYKCSGVCQSAAETFPDFAFLFHKPSTSQAALESLVCSFRKVAWALLDTREFEKIDYLLSLPHSHTDHMAEPTEIMVVYFKLRFETSTRGHRYASFWTRFEATPLVRTMRAMLEKLEARSRPMRESHRAILFLVLVWISLLWLAVY